MKLSKLISMVELLLVLTIGVLVYSYLQTIVESILEYSGSSSLSIDQMLWVQTTLYFIPIFIVVLCIYFIRRFCKDKYYSVMTILIRVIRRHKVPTLLALSLIFVVSLITVFYNHQNDLIYYSTHSLFNERRIIESEQYTKITIGDNSDFSGWGKLDLIEDKPTILFFGGNAQSAAGLFNYFEENGWQDLDAYNFVMIDYPGYGTSKGTPTEESIYQMSLEVYDEISSLYVNEENRLIVMGYSLGTGVATYVAQNRDTEKLILLAPYSSMVDVINSKCPIFYGPLEKVLVNEYDSYNRFSEIEEDILIIASRDDEIINFSLTMKLVEYKAEYDYLYINDVLHNDILYNTDVLHKVSEFIDDNQD